MLIDVTRLLLIWVAWGSVAKRWKTYVDLRADLILTKWAQVFANQRKPVHERPGQMESQVDSSFHGLRKKIQVENLDLLATLLAKPCVYVGWLALCSVWSRSNLHASFPPFGQPTQVIPSWVSSIHCNNLLAIEIQNMYVPTTWVFTCVNVRANFCLAAQCKSLHTVNLRYLRVRLARALQSVFLLLTFFRVKVLLHWKLLRRLKSLCWMNKSDRPRKLCKRSWKNWVLFNSRMSR